MASEITFVGDGEMQFRLAQSVVSVVPTERLQTRSFEIPHLHVLRLLRTFAGVLGEKNRMRAILKKNMANYISLEG